MSALPETGHIYTSFGGLSPDDPHENMTAALALLPVHVSEWVEAMSEAGQVSADAEFTLASATLGRFLKLVPLVENGGGAKKLDREALRKLLNPEILDKLVRKQTLSAGEKLGDAIEGRARIVVVKSELRYSFFEALRTVFEIESSQQLVRARKPDNGGIPRFAGNTAVHKLLNDTEEMGDMTEAMFDFIDGVLANLGKNIFHGKKEESALRVHLHGTLSKKRRDELTDLTSDAFIQELLYPLAQAFFAYWVILRGNRYLSPLAQHDVPEKKGPTVMQILRAVTAQITRELRNEPELANKIYDPDKEEDPAQGRNPNGWSLNPSIIGRGATPDGELVLGDAYAGTERFVERKGGGEEGQQRRVPVSVLPLLRGSFEHLNPADVAALIKDNAGNVGRGQRDAIQHELNKVVHATHGTRITDPGVRAALLTGPLGAMNTRGVRTWIEKGHREKGALLPGNNPEVAAAVYTGIARVVRAAVRDNIQERFDMRPTQFIES